MRWDSLFADLAAQADALEADRLRGEIVGRTRLELGRLTLVERLRGSAGSPVWVFCSGESTAGSLSRVGPDWLLVAEVSGREALVALPHVTGITGLGRYADTTAPGEVWRRMDMRYLLRAIARDRSAAAVTLCGSEVVAGTVDSVGADFIEVAEHPQGEPRRARSVRSVRTVPVGSIVVLRTGG